MNTRRVPLYGNAAVPHGVAIAHSIKRIQGVGRRVLNAARYIVDDELKQKLHALDNDKQTRELTEFIALNQPLIDAACDGDDATKASPELAELQKSVARAKVS